VRLLLTQIKLRIMLNHHGLSTSQTQVSHRVYGKIIIPVVHPDLHHNGSLPHREISDHHVQREGIQHRGSLLIPTTPQDVFLEHNVADVGYVISQNVTQTDTRTSQTLLHQDPDLSLIRELLTTDNAPTTDALRSLPIDARKLWSERHLL